MSGGGGSGTTTQTNEPPAFLAPFLQQLVQAASQAFGGGQLGQVAPFTPEQLQAQQQAIDFAGSSQGRAIPDAASAALQNALSLSQDPTQNPFIQNVVRAAQRPLEQQFEQTILPGISDSAVVAGQVGQSREGIAQGIAGQELTRRSGDISENIFNTALTQGLQLTPQLLALSGPTQQLQLNPAGILEAVGFTRQQQQQAGLNEQQSALQVFADLLRSAGGGGFGTSTTTGPSSTQSPFLQALGGAATGFAIGGPWGAAGGAVIGLLG